ncbi:MULTISPECIES: NUDIX domain-containing protein [unclassified Streptomyces]|uniref:NUDIX domain-containing protein n=1 Tax=unclassified Streptomyces TaxID=2593676 RepID=UPI00190E55D6|nr:MULTISPECIES: NUDIX domain-containing protein [unclassified Streptomyces]MBK3570482.1 NUDIX domain-containing protein [Streptomyces sp. MBT62]MBK6016952.1 NUDIX domain-containing protein [Streptomyces sp. MBT53]
MAQREAIVAVLRRADRVLVIRRGPDSARSGYWAPLSGKLEPGETQEEALVREVHEEVGLAVAPLAKVWQSETDDGSFRLHWWTATETGNGTIVPDPGEVSEVRWVTPSEFLTMAPLFDADREFFERVLPNL